ncbi:hypothetical protein [Pseudomonas laurylsulfatiphila]
MSKLSKYRSVVNISDAAKMLSRLIDEEVTEDDIEELFNSGWLIGHYQCNAAIIRLDLMLEPDMHEQQAAIGNYFVTPTDEEIGHCFAIHYPVSEVLLHGRFRSLALKDAEGNIFGVRDRETGVFIGSSEEDGLLEEVRIEPESILEFAKHANNDDAPPEQQYLSKQSKIANKWCLSDRELFPFYVSDFDRKPNMPEIIPVIERPSSQLIIASLLDIIKEPKRTNYNQTSIISEIVERNPGIRGLSESSLSKAFALAKQISEDAKRVT